MIKTKLLSKRLAVLHRNQENEQYTQLQGHPECWLLWEAEYHLCSCSSCHQTYIFPGHVSAFQGSTLLTSYILNSLQRIC